MINNCLAPWFTETGALFGTDIMHSGDSFSLTDKMLLIAVKRGTAYLVNATVHKKTRLPQIEEAPCLVISNVNKSQPGHVQTERFLFGSSEGTGSMLTKPL